MTGICDEAGIAGHWSGMVDHMQGSVMDHESESDLDWMTDMMGEPGGE